MRFPASVKFRWLRCHGPDRTRISMGNAQIEWTAAPYARRGLMGLVDLVVVGVSTGRLRQNARMHSGIVAPSIALPVCSPFGVLR